MKPSEVADGASVRTSQMHRVWITNTNRLVIFREIIAVCCENQKKHKELCAKNSKLLNVTRSCRGYKKG
jgi:hypothetical protein